MGKLVTVWRVSTTLLECLGKWGDEKTLKDHKDCGRIFQWSPMLVSFCSTGLKADFAELHLKTLGFLNRPPITTPVCNLAFSEVLRWLHEQLAKSVMLSGIQHPMHSYKIRECSPPGYLLKNIIFQRFTNYAYINVNRAKGDKAIMKLRVSDNRNK